MKSFFRNDDYFLNPCSYNLSVMDFMAGQESQSALYSHCSHSFNMCIILMYEIIKINPPIGIIAKILKIKNIGRKRIEIKYSPTPIPVDILEKTFKNLYFVRPNIFNIIGEKKMKEIKNKNTKL